MPHLDHIAYIQYVTAFHIQGNRTLTTNIFEAQTTIVVAGKNFSIEKILKN